MSRTCVAKVFGGFPGNEKAFRLSSSPHSLCPSPKPDSKLFRGTCLFSLPGKVCFEQKGRKHLLHVSKSPKNKDAIFLGTNPVGKVRDPLPENHRTNR